MNATSSEASVKTAVQRCTPLGTRSGDSPAPGGARFRGGAHAGILAGRDELIARLRRNPLFRALCHAAPSCSGKRILLWAGSKLSMAAPFEIGRAHV